MAKSKTTTKKTENKAPEQPVTVTQQPAKHRPVATRRVPVQYTPRIPSARCPGC